MDQGSQSGFSHITIGQNSDEEELPEEEVELIGAVDLAEVSVMEVQPEDTAPPKAQLKGDVVPVLEGEAQAQPQDPLDDNAQPMALTRKITLALCGLGVALAALYILDYWEVISLPF